MGVSENMVEVGVARAEARVARAVCTHDAIAFCGNKAAATRAVLSQDRARFVQDAGHFKTAFHSQTALIYLFTVFRFSVVVVPIPCKMVGVPSLNSVFFDVLHVGNANTAAESAANMSSICVARDHEDFAVGTMKFALGYYTFL